MKVERTIEDGWDCVPELNEAVEELENIKSETYEIKHCVRSSELDVLVEQMTETLQNAIDKLNEIDTNVEYKTIGDE
jgi:hypothetical protein